MRWIIDGHNLIPHIPGLSLSDLDDEDKLILWIQEFLKGNHDSVELYFDKAAIGQTKNQVTGTSVYHPCGSKINCRPGDHPTLQ